MVWVGLFVCFILKTLSYCWSLFSQENRRLILSLMYIYISLIQAWRSNHKIQAYKSRKKDRKLAIGSH